MQTDIMHNYLEINLIDGMQLDAALHIWYSHDASKRSDITLDRSEAEAMRGGAVAARWAHNPKVAGSSPAPATKDHGANRGLSISG